MKKLLIFGLTLCFLGAYLAPAWAGNTDTAVVSAQITNVTDVFFTTDDNSAGTADTISFTVRDNQDPGNPENPNAGYMYAPPRGQVGKNWHLASVTCNGSSVTLSLAVTGTITGDLGGTIDSSKLKVWCGGFFPPGAQTPIAGTASTEWVAVDSWSESVSSAFVGTVPFNYQLDISSAVADTYTGQITITVTSG